MLRKFLDKQLELSEEGKPLHLFRPLISALDSFLYEVPFQTKNPPYIRDTVDLKRWMFLVVLALFPACLVAIWNTGLQATVYQSGNPALMRAYLESVGSLSSYFEFAFAEGRWLAFLKEGLYLFLPLVFISYAVGGAVEVFFAIKRRHEVAEGFLVTGLLYPLILPPTIPYWMAALGVAVGVILSKEIFGGTGMNIVNPALTCRAFLFFAFPGRMSGDVWVGESSARVRESLAKINEGLGLTGKPDAITQETWLAKYNVGFDIKKIHTDAIYLHLNKENTLPEQMGNAFTAWEKKVGISLPFSEISPEQLKAFVTAPLHEAGLALSSGLYESAYKLSTLLHNTGPLSGNGLFFLGNKLGCLGETSGLAALLGALFIILTGTGSWRTMAGVIVGALFFAYGLNMLGFLQGDSVSAVFTLPGYRHLLLGGLAFGLVFMATDPVSSPSMPKAQWIYGIFIGIVTILIRAVNPAYPEGVMLAILMGNVFAPLFDYYAAQIYRRKRRVAHGRA